MQNKGKIAVLVSGGVDSSVALALLKEQGYELEAFYLKIWLEDELSYLADCPWEEDLGYVRMVCSQLDVPLRVVSMQEIYWKRVVSYTLGEVKAGRTPSPDILCNQFVKFGAFFEVIGEDFDFVATGHYATKEDKDSVAWLKCAKDPVKDQTYFLSRLAQVQLQKVLFPIGHLLKSEVREEAARLALPNRARKDSQGICFLGKFKFADFIKHHLGERQGDLIEFETGMKIGEHSGFWFFTIGQRKGIGLSGGPWFVVAKDSQRNIVFVSKNYHSEDKDRSEFFAIDCQWISNRLPDKNCRVKVRHGELFYSAQITFSDKNDTVVFVKIDGQDQGIAEGQFVVFYQGEYCLGSGVISSSLLEF